MRTPRVSFRYFSLLLLGCCLGLAAAEIVARLSFSKNVTELTASRESFRSRRAQPSQGLVELAHWEDSLSLHPFFGYVGNPAHGNVNRFGFFTKHEIQLCGSKLCWGDDAFTVGIFGGSLAGQVGSDEEALAALVGSMFPGKKIRVVNFALAGQAQPQALHVFSYFRELVQVAIFIDGLNEIWNPVDNNRFGFPPVYAKSLHYRGLADRHEVQEAKEAFRLSTERSLLPIWRHSALAHVLWERAQGKAMRLLQKFESSSESKPFFQASRAELVKLGVEEWASAHRQISFLAKEKGIRVLRFLQPTLLAGKKKRTIEEDRVASLYPELRNLVELGYPQLEREAKKLGSKDLVPFFDKDMGEVWIDAAHLNSRGITLLREAISKELGHR